MARYPSFAGRLNFGPKWLTADDPPKRSSTMFDPTVTRLSILAASGSALVLAACSPASEAPPPEPKIEASAPTTGAMTMAQTPFSTAEAKMHEAMMAATAVDAGEAWVRKMIPHHQGALEMSEIVLRETQDADIRRMARKTIDMQTKDIAEFERWLAARDAKGSAAAAPGGAMPFAAAETRMNDAMMAATDANTDRTWASKMIAHHQGALDMAEVVMRESQDANIRRMAQKTIEMQTADIGELRTWLDAHPANGR